MRPSLKIALYGSDLISNDFHSDGYNRVSEAFVQEILGPIDIYDPVFVTETLAIPIPLHESYGEYSPQFRSLILLEAGRIAAFWSSAVSALGDAKDSAVDYLKDKYEQGKEAAKEKVEDFKDATSGFAKKLGAFTQTMWSVTTGGGIDIWLSSLRWQVKRVFKWFKSKFEKLKTWMQSFSWLDFVRKPIEWVWEKLTYLKDQVMNAEGWKGALVATGALAGISIIKEKIEEKIGKVFEFVDKGLADAGWDPTAQVDQDGLLATGKEMIGDKLKEEITAMFKDTFIGEIVGYVKQKIEDFMSTAAMSAVSGGWAAYKETLTKAYGAINTVLSAIAPALKRAGGVKMGDKLIGGVHKVVLDHRRTRGVRLTEETLRVIIRNQILEKIERESYDQSRG